MASFTLASVIADFGTPLCLGADSAGLRLWLLHACVRLSALVAKAVRLGSLAAFHIALGVEHLGRTLVGFQNDQLKRRRHAVRVFGVHQHCALTATGDRESLALDTQDRETRTGMRRQVIVNTSGFSAAQVGGQVARVKGDDIAHLSTPVG